MGLIAIVAVVGMFFYLWRRINKLEKLLHNQHSTTTATTATAAYTPTAVPHQPTSQTQAVPTSVAMPATPAPAVYATTPNPFIEWIKEDFFVKLGAALLLIAFGWFVSYAFLNNWIGPIGRITLGLLLGVGIMSSGLWRIRTHLQQGAIFTVLGSTVVLLTVFAAREIYEFFTPASALGMMFLSIVFVAFVAVRYERKALALAGLLLGGVAPLLTNTDPNVIGIFSYLLVLLLGSLWVMRRLQAPSLPLASFIIVSAYSLPYVIGQMLASEQSLALLFAFAFTFIFFGSNLLSVVYRRESSAEPLQMIVAIGTGLYITIWIWTAIDPIWQSLVFSAWAVVFTMGAFLVYRHTTDRVPFYIYGAVGVGLLAAATAAELSGPALTIAFTAEITALIAMTTLSMKSNETALKLTYLFIAPAIMSTEHMAALSWKYGFFHEDFAALAAMMLCGWLCASLLTRYAVEGDTTTRDTVTVLFVAGSAYAAALVWLSTHAVLLDDVATASSLFVYTVAGIAIYLYGQAKEQSAQRIFGGIIVGLVVTRLLLIDVWEMALAGRIITFAVIGVLLISTAFIRKRK